jgi:ER lumen protein retaining receptor
MKIFFMVGSYLTVFFVYAVHRNTYQSSYDKLRPEMLIIPVTVLSLVVNHETTFEEVSWTWSIYMEAVALLPQYYMLWNGGHLDYGLLSYLVAMGGYRGMYIFNWVYRYNTENYFDMIAVVGGVIETSIAVFGLAAVILRNISKYSNLAGVQMPSVYTIPSAVSVFENSFRQMKSSDRKCAEDTEALIQNPIVSPK